MCLNERQKKSPDAHLGNEVLHPPPYTLHPTLYTLHPTPYTLHPTPFTLHPSPYPPHLRQELGARNAIEGSHLAPWSHLSRVESHFDKNHVLKDL